MSLAQCQAAYLKLSERIFNPKRHQINVLGRSADFLQANGKFNSKELEKAIKEVVIEYAKSEKPLEELLQDSDPRCKVSVSLTTLESRVRHDYLTGFTLQVRGIYSRRKLQVGSITLIRQRLTPYTLRRMHNMGSLSCYICCSHFLRPHQNWTFPTTVCGWRTGIQQSNSTPPS